MTTLNNLRYTKTLELKDTVLILLKYLFPQLENRFMEIKRIAGVQTRDKKTIKVSKIKPLYGIKRHKLRPCRNCVQNNN